MTLRDCTDYNRIEYWTLSPEEFLEHSSTKLEIEMLQGNLRGIVEELNSLDSNAENKLEQLSNLLSDMSNRIYKLKLDLQEPPTYNRITSRYKS